MGRTLSIALNQRSFSRRKSEGKRKGKTKMPKHPHPNPTPELHPHPSSLQSLCDYIDEHVINLGRHYNDQEMECFCTDHEHSREFCPVHLAGGMTIIAPTSDPRSTSPVADPSSSKTPLPRDSPSTSPALPSSSSTPAPPPSEPVDFTGSDLSPHHSPMSPAQRDDIETFIPDTILSLPSRARLVALHAWAEYVHEQGLTRPRITTLQRRLRKESVSKAMVMPWDEGVEEWDGSFPDGAVEVVGVRGEGGIGVEGVYTLGPHPHRGGKRKGSVEGRRKSSVEGKQEVGERCFDMNDGHVIGRDWGCGKEGPVMLFDGKARKDSVLDRVVHVFRRAVFA